MRTTAYRKPNNGGRPEYDRQHLQSIRTLGVESANGSTRFGSRRAQ